MLTRGGIERGREAVGGDGLDGGKGTTKSGLRLGELSSLLGGVLNGDVRAWKDGLRASGCSMLLLGIPTTVGFAGIFGFSARLTGGGTTFGFSFRDSVPLFITCDSLERSALGARGAGVDARLEC